MALPGSFGQSARWGMIGAALVLSLGAASPAIAGVLADFQPEPASPYVPEFGWTVNGDLVSLPGAIGNGFGTPGAGDGDLPVANQIPAGLTVATPFTVPGISGGTVNAPGTTTFRNATLQIIPLTTDATGFHAAGPARVFAGNVIQPLGPAVFRLWSNDLAEAVADIENPVLLLEGIAQDASIMGIQGSSTGGTLSATVTYTAGQILQAAGWPQAAGGFSWSFLNIYPVLSIDGQTQRLSPFTANGVGQFSGFYQIPEPATLCLLSAGGLLLAGRRRR